jgi:hypothetical protein
LRNRQQAEPAWAEVTFAFMEEFIFGDSFGVTRAGFSDSLERTVSRQL